MILQNLLLLSGLALSFAGVQRARRSIDPPSYGSGGRSARSYEFEEDLLDGEYVRRPRQAAQANYGAPGGGGGGIGGIGGGGGGVGGGGRVPGGPGGRQAPGATGEPLMPYRYGYAVQDDIGNDFNQQEQSDGAQVWRGGEVTGDVGDDEIFLDHRTVLSRPAGLQDTDRHLQRPTGDWLCGKTLENRSDCVSSKHDIPHRPRCPTQTLAVVVFRLPQVSPEQEVEVVATDLAGVAVEVAALEAVLEVVLEAVDLAGLVEEPKLDMEVPF